jgi:hypothetical protein
MGGQYLMLSRSVPPALARSCSAASFWQSQLLLLLLLLLLLVY